MADHDIEGQVRLLLHLLTSGEWSDFWNELDYHVESFDSLEIPYNTPDIELWRICQARQIVLITGNRNKAGPHSLESAISQFNTPSSLPVLTIGDPNRVLSNRDYAQHVVSRLLEHLINLENIRGTGQLYIP